MMRFTFQARAADSTLKSGVVEAVDAEAARAELRAEGLVVESLEPLAEDRLASSGGQLSNEEVVELTAQIAELAKGKVPLASGLRALSLNLPRGRQARVMNRLADHLDRGIPLDEAANMPDVRLPPYLRGLLACGLKNERLGLVLEQYLSHERLRDDLRRRVWSALAYPAVLMLLLAAWCYFAAAVLLPDIATFVSDTNSEQPALFTGFDAIRSYMPYFAVTVVLVMLIMTVLLRFGSHLRLTSALLVHLPLVGPLWRYRGIAEFADLLGLLAGEGVPMPQALNLTATALSDGELSAACRQSAHLSAKGVPLAECLARISAFPPTLIPFAAWGDRLSDPAAGLRTAADWYRVRCDLQNDLLGMVIPPLALLVVAGIILVTIRVLLIPIEAFLSWMIIF